MLHFLQMIEHLRNHEKVMLYEKVIAVSEEEKLLVLDFLKGEYEKETLDYPIGYPPFNPDAALWAAQTTYVAAQLILYRETEERDLNTLFPVFDSIVTVDAMLSADLCLRFIPDMIYQLRIIDSDDSLIGRLESTLQRWPYSGITYKNVNFDKSDLTIILDSAYLNKMCCERIIKNKLIAWAEHPLFNQGVRAQLGMYSEQLWREFKNIA